MRFWLSRSSEVPLREQLVTQIRLGILSGDLKLRQKLPSTRELARRFRIHSNTVSAAYRELDRSGWVEVRKGSGVYVRGRSVERTAENDLGLDEMIAKFFRTARANGHSLSEIQSRLQHWLALQPPDHFLLIEPDPELRRILVHEIEGATKIHTAGAGLDDCSRADVLTGAVPVAMYGQIEAVRAALPSGTEVATLRSRSIPESLQGQTRPAAESLIAIVSRWPEFLRWARTVLVAAGLDADSLSFRDARARGWQRGLKSAALVITDSLMVHELPEGCEVRSFNILSDSSLDEIRRLAEDLIGANKSSRPSVRSATVREGQTKHS
jgi:DNA-binding transcriptional regulator YhcF (GntR family)